MRKYRYGTFHKFFLDCARRHTAPCAATQRPVCQPPPAAARTGTWYTRKALYYICKVCMLTDIWRRDARFCVCFYYCKSHATAMLQ